QHPERGEEALRRRELEARLHVPVGELVEVVRAVVGLRPGGGEQTRLVRTRAALTSVGLVRGGRGGDELRGAARHLDLGRRVILPAAVERRGASAEVPVEARRQLGVVVARAGELFAERE